MASRLTLIHKTPAQVPTGGTDISATSHSREGKLTMSDVGFAQLRMQNDDALLAGIARKDFVQFHVDGTPRLLMYVEHLDTMAISPSEKVAEETTISGRGSLATWEGARVFPPNGVTGQPHTETRQFDWGAPELDISGWLAAVELTQAGQGSEGTPPPEFPEAWLRYPLGWSDPTGYWVWYEAAGAGPAMKAVDAYFARDVNVVTPGYRSIYVAADNRHDLRVDGVLISEFDEVGSKEGYQYALRADVYMTAGVHRIAIRVSNDDAATLAGFLYAQWTQGSNRDDDTLELRADTTWGAVGDPADPPGFTAGEVIRVLLEEAQADGTLAGWSLSFTDTLDSDGNAWPTDRTFSFRVGMDLLSVLRQMAATDIDFIADPSDLILHAFVIDAMGVASADATAVLANLGRLQFSERA